MKFSDIFHYSYLLDLLPWILLAAFIVYFGKVLKYILSDKSIGFNIILSFGAFSSWFYVNDFFEVDYKVTWAIPLIAACISAVYLYSKQQLFTETKEFAKWFVTYLTAVFLIAIPLLFVFPKNVIVTGVAISNDSIVHSLFAKGQEYTRSLNMIKDDDFYPRAFHSSIFYVSKISNQDARFVVLLGQIVMYAFMIFAGADILFYTDLKNRRIKYLLTLFLVVPFLPLSTLYTNYASQIMSVPFVYLGLFSILNLGFRNKMFIRDLLLIGVITLFSFNIYSIFAVNILALGVVIKVILELLDNRKSLKSLFSISKIKNEITQRYINKKEVLLIFIISAIGIIPAAYLAKQAYVYIKNTGAFLLNTNGNLSDFLSPWHITGFWVQDAEYRYQPKVDESYILMIIFALQLYFIFRAKLTKSLKYMLYILIGLNIFGVSVLHNTYGHFKYLTYAVPLFVFMFAYGFTNWLDWIKYKAVRITILVAVLLSIVLIPAPAFQKYPVVVAGGGFEPLQNLHDNYLSKAPTLYFGFDAWMSYFRTQNDDYMPMLGYLPLEYNKEYIRYFILDSTYAEGYFDKSLNSYYKSHRDLEQKVSQTPEHCIVEYLERYTIYDFECN